MTCMTQPLLYPTHLALYLSVQVPIVQANFQMPPNVHTMVPYSKNKWVSLKNDSIMVTPIN